jgi:hypothetical protein
MKLGEKIWHLYDTSTFKSWVQVDQAVKLTMPKWARGNANNMANG